MSYNEFFEIVYPSGTVSKFRALGKVELEYMKDQCAGQQILSIEEIGQNPVHCFYPKEIKSWFSAATTCFLDGEGKSPVVGKRYKVRVAEIIEDMGDYGLCGSTITCLLDKQPIQKNIQVFAPNKCPLYFTTDSSTAVINYSVTVVFQKFIITLDFSNLSKEMIQNVYGPVDIVSGTNTSIGSISGTLHRLAYSLPFESLLRVILEVHRVLNSYSTPLQTVIVTGSDWSGSIAHVAAIILRDMLSEQGFTVPVRAISFSGPLSGCARFNGSITQSGELINHVTVCNNNDILDRLIGDFQAMSPLRAEGNDFESWNNIFKVINHDLSMYQEGSCSADIITLDVRELTKVELNLRNHPAITSDNSLVPVGRYVFVDASGKSVIESDREIIEYKTRKLEGKSFKGRVIPFTVQDFLGKYSSFSNKPFNLPIRILPKLISFSMIVTPHRTTFHFTGEYLDCVCGRVTFKELEINANSISNLPFELKSGQILPGKHAKIISLVASFGKLKLDIVDCKFDYEKGEILVRTDFGKSNTVMFTSRDVTRGEESAPSKALHPTMNVEFLSAGLLRIAIYCRKYGGIEALKGNPRMEDLWKLLLDMESILIPDKPRLENYVLQYLEKEIDIGTMRNMCLEPLSIMSAKTVAEFVQKENIIQRGGRKLLGILGHIGSGALFLSGVLLMLPPALLMAPVSMFLDQDFESMSTSTQVGLGIYLGVTGIIALPGAILGAMGLFLHTASNYAMQDYQSTQYKILLKQLITLFNGNVQDVVDELCPLEDRVVMLASTQFPEIDLKASYVKDIELAIRQHFEKEDPLAEKLMKYPHLIEKLVLVGRIHGIRSILENNILIGFIGVHNAGKSTTIENLFNVKTGADLIERTEDPTPHLLGGWIEEKTKSSTPFREWMSKCERNSLQLYAVDFPGTTDERLPVSLITSYTAELASMFVVVLKAGHIASPEKDVVTVAKNNHKPFIVVINHIDTIKHEISQQHKYDKLLSNYAKILEVSEKQIIFSSAFSESNLVRLRGTIFGCVQNLLGNSAMANSLALHFMSNTMVEQLEEICENDCSADMFALPDQLCSAASSLLFGVSSSFTAEKLYCHMKNTLAQQKNIVGDSSMKTPTEITKSYSTTLLEKFVNCFRQIACTLNIDDEIYQLVIASFLCTHEYLKTSSSEAFLSSTQSIHDKPIVLDELLCTVTLNTLSEKVVNYFSNSIVGGSNKTIINILQVNKSCNVLCTEILLGIHSIVNTWVDRKYSYVIACAAIRSIFVSNNSSETFDDATVLSHIGEIEAAARFQQKAFHDINKSSPTANSFDEMSPLDNNDQDKMRTSFSSSDANNHVLPTELERYQTAKRQLIQIKQLTFSTFARIKHNNTITIDKFRETIKNHHSKIYTQIKTLEVNDNNLVEDVLTQLASLDSNEFSTADIRFKKNDDPSVDMHGVTRSILTKVATEINNHCDKYYFRKDQDNQFIYFDPNYTFQNEHNTSRKLYLRGIGRLIGLCLRKSSIGTTLPIRFPLTMYKWILGYRIGFDDLVIINPQIANTIQSICLADELTLKEMDLKFIISIQKIPLSMNIDNADDNDENNINHRTVVALLSLVRSLQQNLNNSNTSTSITTATKPTIESVDIELIEGGENQIVSFSNRVDYLRRLIEYYLCLENVNKTSSFLSASSSLSSSSSMNKTTTNNAINSSHSKYSSTSIMQEFILGVQDLCPRELFNTLTPSSLQLVIEGEQDIDINLWKENTVIKNMGFDIKNYIESFWNIIHQFSTEEKQKLLCFTIGTTTLPATGFKDLNPPFTLVITNTADEDKLPTSHTCFHMLLIPRYSSEEKLKNKLLLAILETDSDQLGMI